MAMGRTHALSGVAAILLTAQAADPVRPLHIAAAAMLGAGAALMPDWDHPSGTAARTFGPVTRALCKAVARISLGHRKLTHSLVGVGVFTALAWIVQAVAATAPADGALLHARQIPLIAVVAMLAGSGLRALRVGDFHRDSTLGWANLTASTAIAYALVSLAPGAVEPLPWIVAAGAAAHIAGDMCTHSGCPLLAPFTWRNMWLLPEFLRWSTTDRERFIPERHLVTPIIWLVIGWSVLDLAGIFRNFTLTT